MKKGFYPLDSAGIIHLAALRPGHSNVFRISVVLKEPVCPEILQQAVEHLKSRFPTVVAGIREGVFAYRVVPSEHTPVVQRDENGLLAFMSMKEIRSCATRILYQGNILSMESFHALADGYGGLAFVKALAAEYLRLAHGVCAEKGDGICTPEQAVSPDETADLFLEQEPRKKVPFRRIRSYQPDEEQGKTQTHAVHAVYRLEDLLAAAHRYNTSLTTFIAAAMVKTIVEHQRTGEGSPHRPVRILVPINLRKMFGGSTLRNFSLYAFASAQPEESVDRFEDLVATVGEQLRSQFTKERLGGMITTNTQMTRNVFLRALPLPLKYAILRAGFRVIGEVDSCLTLSNVGQVQFPPAMDRYIERVNVYLMPRVRSPHNFGMIAQNGKMHITLTRNCAESELEQMFFQTLRSLGCEALQITDPIRI